MKGFKLDKLEVSFLVTMVPRDGSWVLRDDPPVSIDDSTAMETRDAGEAAVLYADTEVTTGYSRKKVEEACSAAADALNGLFSQEEEPEVVEGEFDHNGLLHTEILMNSYTCTVAVQRLTEKPEEITVSYVFDSNASTQSSRHSAKDVLTFVEVHEGKLCLLRITGHDKKKRWLKCYRTPMPEVSGKALVEEVMPDLFGEKEPAALMDLAGAVSIVAVAAAQEAVQEASEEEEVNEVNEKVNEEDEPDEE